MKDRKLKNLPLSLRCMPRNLVFLVFMGCAAWVSAGPQVQFGANEKPIHDAARMGTRKDVETIIKSTPAARDTRTELGITPLHYAAMNVDSGPLKALIAAGAAVNVRDGEGRTPLHMAAFANRTESGKLLLEAGADPSLKTDAGRDVLSMARKVRADELAGVISLWILKGCKAGKPC